MKVQEIVQDVAADCGRLCDEAHAATGAHPNHPNSKEPLSEAQVSAIIERECQAHQRALLAAFREDVREAVEISAPVAGS